MTEHATSPWIHIALPRFVSEGGAFDFAFVDGNHRFDAVFLDLIFLGRLVRCGGVIVLDDYQLPRVARAASFCVTNLGWTLEEVSAPVALHQWAVLRTTREPKVRPFDYFVTSESGNRGPGERPWGRGERPSRPCGAP